MATLVVRHSVSDFDSWKAGFDAHQPARVAHGASAHRVLRDGTDIEVLIDFPTADAARGFAADPALKNAMTTAGVVGAPEVRIREQAEQLTY